MRNTTRSLVFLTASLVPATHARAQVGELWRTVLPGGAAGGAANDASGAVYLCGQLASGSAARMTKLDAGGAVLWTRDDPDPHSDFGALIGVEPGDAHAWMALRSYSGSDVRMLRYDSAGQLASSSVPWNGAGNGEDDIYGGVAFDGAGNAFVAGRSWSGLPTRYDALVISYDPSGTVRWATTIDGGTGFQDHAESIAVDGAGNAFVAGRGNEGPGGFGDLLVAKLSPTGQVLWTRLFAGTGGGQAYDVVCDPSGDVLACGTSGSGTEGILVRYDTAGNLVWSRAHSIGIVCSFDTLTLDGAGAALVAGFQQIGFGLQPSADVLTFKYDAAGNLLWQRVWNSPLGFADLPRGIAVDPAGNATIGIRSRVSAAITAAERLAYARYDADGGLRASGLLTTNTNGYAFNTAVLQRADGSVVLSATTWNPSTSQGSGLVIALADQARAFCFGDGLAEACPCGNASEPGSASGCANSFGSGASLVDAGIASIGADSLVLNAASMPPTATTIFLQGSTEIAPTTFGDGLRCVGGALLRLYVTSASGGAVSAPAGGDPSISARSAALGDSIAPGTSRYLQAYYRDPSPSFCPAPPGNTWNVTNALEIGWTN